MNTKHWIALIAGTAGLAIAADYTVPKTWTRTGASFARSATLIFDPLQTDLPVEIRVRVKKVVQEDELVTWTAGTVNALPDMVTNSINGLVLTNTFKTRMKSALERGDIVRAYNWGLVDGREASMLAAPVIPPPFEP